MGFGGVVGELVGGEGEGAGDVRGDEALEDADAAVVAVGGDEVAEGAGGG